MSSHSSDELSRSVSFVELNDGEGLKLGSACPCNSSWGNRAPVCPVMAGAADGDPDGFLVRSGGPVT